MKGLVDEELLASLAKSMELDAVEKPKKENQDYQDQKLWREIQFEMQMMVWAVVNDGIITDSEMRMMMNVLSQHGVPDNQHTYYMLKGFLQEEVKAYAGDYDKLSDVEKEHQLEREVEIKQELRERVREKSREARASMVGRGGGKSYEQNSMDESSTSKSFVSRILGEAAGEKLHRTLEDLLGFMGFETKEEPETGTFVARYKQEEILEGERRQGQ